MLYSFCLSGARVDLVVHLGSTQHLPFIVGTHLLPNMYRGISVNFGSTSFLYLDDKYKPYVDKSEHKVKPKAVPTSAWTV